jgi:glucose-fructose oxidoreductase
MKPTPHSTGPLSRRSFLGKIAAGTAAFSIIAKTRGQGAAPKKLGVAIVGLGNYARGQIGPALRLTENCQLMGVVTGDPAMKGKKWAADYGFPEKNIWNYETMPQIADNKDIDIVYVITPNSLHAEEIITAAKAGKHVISEKPITTNVAEAERAIAACKGAKVKLSVGYRLHFDPTVQEYMRMAKAKEFGGAVKMNGEFSFVARVQEWRQKKQFAGGGPLMDLGVYVMQASCMGAGGVVPVAVTAKFDPTTKPQIFQDVEEGLKWTMEFPGGEVAECAASYNGSANRFRIEGDKGWLDFKGMVTRRDGTKAEASNAFMYSGVAAETNRGPLNLPKVNQQAKQMDDFVTCIREGRESRVSGEMGLRDMKLIEAIYASAAANGKRTLVKA